MNKRFTTELTDKERRLIINYRRAEQSMKIGIDKLLNLSGSTDKNRGGKIEKIIRGAY